MRSLLKSNNVGEKLYIGQSSRPLKEWITSHKSDRRLYSDRYALAMYVYSFGCRMDYYAADNFQH